MKLNILSCDAHRPDRRAIAKCISEISSNINESLSIEFTEIILEGDPVEIEIDDKNSCSTFWFLKLISRNNCKASKFYRRAS